MDEGLYVEISCRKSQHVAVKFSARLSSRRGNWRTLSVADTMRCLQAISVCLFADLHGCTVAKTRLYSFLTPKVYS